MKSARCFILVLLAIFFLPILSSGQEEMDPPPYLGAQWVEDEWGGYWAGEPKGQYIPESMLDAEPSAPVFRVEVGQNPDRPIRFRVVENEYWEKGKRRARGARPQTESRSTN